MILAIDPSLTGTAAAIGAPDAEADVQRFPSRPQGDGAKARIDRYSFVLSSLLDWIDGTDCPVGLVLIEGYGFASHKANVQGEFGGLLRWHLLDFGAPLIEVPPATLKKFAAGKGNADKIAMTSAILQRWERGFATSDEFDAYALWHLGRCLCGVEPATAKMREAVATVAEQLPKGWTVPNLTPEAASANNGKQEAPF